MRPGHDLHRVGDDLAAHQRVVHAFVVHGQAVAHADDVELQRDAAGLVDPVLDLLGDGAQVHVPGDQLVERVGHPDEGPPGVAARRCPGRAEENGEGPSRVPWSVRRYAWSLCDGGPARRPMAATAVAAPLGAEPGGSPTDDRLAVGEAGHVELLAAELPQALEP